MQIKRAIKVTRGLKRDVEHNIRIIKSLGYEVTYPEGNDTHYQLYLENTAGLRRKRGNFYPFELNNLVNNLKASPTLAEKIR